MQPNQEPARALGVIRASLHDNKDSQFFHLTKLAETLSQTKNIDTVVLAMPNDEYHASVADEVTFCQTFLGDTANMTNRLLETAKHFNASCLVDCSLLTQCLAPGIYDELLEFHNDSPGGLTRPHLWYPEYLPNVIDVATLDSIPKEVSWPYYSHVPEDQINQYLPDLDKITHLFGHLDPICQELVIHKGRELRRSMNLAIHPYDPTQWAVRCRLLLSEIEKLFHTRNVSVLEVGCGRRFGLGILLRMAGVAKYTGIDLNIYPVSDHKIRAFEEWLAFNQETTPIPGMTLTPITRDDSFKNGHSFLEGFAEQKAMNACALEFADQTFDLIYSDAVLEHISPCESAIKEMYRVLKPGGYALHGIDFKDHRTASGDNHLYVSKEEWNLIQQPNLINLTRPAEIYSWASQAGFRIVSISEEKFTEVDIPRIHADHLDYGLSDALTYSSQVVLQKPR